MKTSVATEPITPICRQSSDEAGPETLFTVYLGYADRCSGFLNPVLAEICEKVCEPTAFKQLFSFSEAVAFTAIAFNPCSTI